jgi:hypothetical protein
MIVRSSGRLSGNVSLLVIRPAVTVAARARIKVNCTLVVLGCLVDRTRGTLSPTGTLSATR